MRYHQLSWHWNSHFNRGIKQSIKRVFLTFQKTTKPWFLNFFFSLRILTQKQCPFKIQWKGPVLFPCEIILKLLCSKKHCLDRQKWKCPGLWEKGIKKIKRFIIVIPFQSIGKQIYIHGDMHWKEQPEALISKLYIFLYVYVSMHEMCMMCINLATRLYYDFTLLYINACICTR